MKLYFKSGSPSSDTEERKRVEDMAQEVTVKVNEQVKELMKKFSDILNESPEDEELGKWISIQTLLPLSSLIIRTFTTITINRPTYDLYMEKLWAAIEESREISAENDSKVMSPQKKTKLWKRKDR